MSNENDHETTASLPKHIHSLIISCPARFTLHLARTPLAHSHPHILQLVLAEMGLDDQEDHPVVPVG